MNPQGATAIGFREGDHGLESITMRTPQGEEFTLSVEDGEMAVSDPHDDGGEA